MGGGLWVVVYYGLWFMLEEIKYLTRITIMIMRIMMIRPHNSTFKSIWDFQIVFWFGDETTFVGSYRSR